MNTSAILIVAAALAVAPFGSALAQTDITWNAATTYDPKPDKTKDNGELTLPMPCGGAMVFRKVEVRNNDGQHDRRFTIGSKTETRDVHLAGPFGPAQGRQGVGPVTYYYLAKYELSEAQYDAIGAGKDPDKCPQRLSLKPRGKLSQMDARRVAGLYTEWLKSARPKALSAVDSEGRSVIVRLPTEVEWEFAARGGMAVPNKAEFDRDVPDFNGTPLKDSDHFFTLESEGNRPWDIGYGQPNALGLYNMLGNLAELTDDAFSPVVDHRLIGLTGNPLVKGGSYRTQPVDIALGLRSEMKIYDDQGGPVPARWIGTRFVLSAMVESSVKQIQAMDERQIAEKSRSANIKEEWVSIFRLIENMHLSCGDAHSKDEVALHDRVSEKVAMLRNYSEFNGPVNLRFMIINGAIQLSMINEFKKNIRWVNQTRDCSKSEERSDQFKCIPSEEKIKYRRRMELFIDGIMHNNKNIAMSISSENRIQDMDEVIWDALEDPSYYYISDYLCSPDFLPAHVVKQLNACRGRVK